MYFVSIKSREGHEFDNVLETEKRDEAEYKTFVLWNTLHSGNFAGAVVVERYDDVQYEFDTEACKFDYALWDTIPQEA